jgi:hypothetical protein
MTSFRDRFFTRRVAKAMTSPSAILLGGVGTAGVILSGAALPLAPVVGIALYAARVAAAMERKTAHAVDLRSLTDPWRTFVADAIDARQRYGRALETASTGPLRDRLGEIGRRLDDGVEESWRIARRGMALESALRQLEDPRVVQERLEHARRGGAAKQLEQSLQAQLDSTTRIVGVAQDARHRLQLLDARLDEAVARAVELALSSDDPGAAGGLGSDVDAVVGDMEALRQALEETNRPSQAVGQ